MLRARPRRPSIWRPSIWHERCTACRRQDLHALADDKQGTLFRVEVRLDGELGFVTIVADPATKAALYDAFSRACGLRG